MFTEKEPVWTGRSTRRGALQKETAFGSSFEASGAAAPGLGANFGCSILLFLLLEPAGAAPSATLRSRELAAPLCLALALRHVQEQQLSPRAAGKLQPSTLAAELALSLSQVLHEPKLNLVLEGEQAQNVRHVDELHTAEIC